jgi:hypothetical protein
VAPSNLMRFSLKKTAYAALSGAAKQEIRANARFTIAGDSLGSPGHRSDCDSPIENERACV